MPRATRDDVSIHYERDAGADDPVVFLQGLGLGRWSWRWQREAVVGDHEVLAPDTRGTGRSDADLSPVVTRLPRTLRAPLLSGRFGHSASDLAADLEAVLADAGAERAHLVGADLGGVVALEYALAYDRAVSLTLCGTSHGGPEAVPLPGEARNRLVGASGGTSEREAIRDRLRVLFTERFTARNPHLLDRIVEWSREQDAPAPVREAQAAALGGFDAADRLDEIRVPTLVVHGTTDRVVPVANGRLLAEKIPDARLVEFEDGSHLVVIEDAGRVNARLREFLADADRRRRPIA